MNKRLQDRVAMVMGGGARGLAVGNGEACAIAYAREGARVAVVDYNPEFAEATCALIAKEGGEAIAIRADCTKSAEVLAAVERVMEQYGRIDILLNNIGGGSLAGDVVEISEEDWDREFDLNLRTAFLGMKHVIPIMEAQGSGTITNITSVMSSRLLQRAQRGEGYVNMAYVSAKAALDALTRAVALYEAGKGIRVNGIRLGYLKTPPIVHIVENAGVDEEIKAQYYAGRAKSVPMGAQGDAWNTAGAAVFLASDEASYITGVILAVDGGLEIAAPA
ncbi:MAG: SDR family oxidoreductase [Sphingopyxis sp.]|nr:SDR family oxidoreductase [Sphingopyxis sp.]